MSDGVIQMNIDENDLIYEEPTIPSPKQAKPTKIYSLKHKSNFDPKFQYIFYSFFEMPSERNNTPIVWTNLNHLSFQQMIQRLKDDINNEAPKMMTVGCFDRMIPHIPNDVIVKNCKQLIKLTNEGGIHQISFTTHHFIPSKQAYWYRTAQINSDMRILNIDRKIPPFQIHKAVMKHRDGDHGPLIVRGVMWIEHVKKSGLGTNFSNEGLHKIMDVVERALGLQFVDMPRTPSKRFIGFPQPPKLCTTEGYINNNIMCNLLKNKGEFNVRPASTSSLPRVPPPPPHEQPQRSASQNDVPMRKSPTSPSGAQGNSSDFTPNKNRQVFFPTEDAEGPFNVGRVKLRHDPGDDDFDDEIPSSDKTKYNQSECKSMDALQGELSKLKLDTKEIKQRERRFEKKIEDLNDEIDELENTTEKQDKLIRKYIKEIEKTTLEAETQRFEIGRKEREIDNLKSEVKMQTEKVKQLKSQYDFLKSIHDAKNQIITDEWHTMVDTLKKGGVHMSDQLHNVMRDSDEDTNTERKPKKKKKKE